MCRFVSEAEKRHTMSEFAASKLDVFFSRAISAAENKPSYFIDNLKSYRATDRWHVLRLYKFPKGTAMISDSFTESIEFSAQGGVDAEIVSAKLGFDVTRSTTISASWSGYYDYPVTITVYPVYEYITGSLFETVDGRTRHVGTFTVKKPIGTEIRVS